MGRAEGLGELELLLVEVDGDDRIGLEDRGGADRRQTDAADAEDRNGLAGPHLCGVQHGAGAGQHRAADDAADIARMLLRDRHDQFLRGLHVARPGIDRAVRGLALEGGACHHPSGWPAHRGARHPGDDALVADLDVGDVLADAGHDAGAFMAEQERAGDAVIVHLVQLRMAHAAGVKLDGDLIRTGIGQLQLFEQETSTDFGLHSGDGLHCPASLGWLLGLPRASSRHYSRSFAHCTANFAGQ